MADEVALKELNAVEMDKKRANFSKSRNARGCSPEYFLQIRKERHLIQKHNAHDFSITSKAVKRTVKHTIKFLGECQCKY